MQQSWVKTREQAGSQEAEVAPVCTLGCPLREIKRQLLLQTIFGVIIWQGCPTQNRQLIPFQINLISPAECDLKKKKRLPTSQQQKFPTIKHKCLVPFSKGKCN